MRALLCLILAVASVSLAFAQETGSAWAVDYDRFYRVDLETRQATFVGEVGDAGPQPMADLSGLTMTPDGMLYAASDTLKGLVRIDPATGAGTFIGRFGIGQSDPTAPLDFGMTAACDGSLWLSSPVTRQLWKVNPASAKATLVGQLGHDITGLVFERDALYGVGGRGEEGWYGIDTKTGHATLLGGLGSMVDYITSASPAILPDGTVLAVFNYVPPPPGQAVPDWSDLVRIDKTTGETTVLGTIHGPSGLRGIGVRGFAVGPPVCGSSVAAPVHAAVPTLGDWARWVLMLAMMGIALATMRRQTVR